MNFSALVGICLSASVIWFGVFGSVDHFKVLFLPQVLFIVIGGTISASLVVFPVSRLLGVFKFIFFGFIFKSKAQDYSVAKQIVTTYYDYMMNPENFAINFKFHPFLCEGVGMLKKNKMSDDELYEILDSRIEFFKNQYSVDTTMLRALAKFPPAFGFISALAILLSQVGSETSQTTLNAGLTPILVSCLWGWILPMAILLPLADHSQKTCDEEIQTRRMIMHALLVMNRRQSVTYLTETLSGYLSVDNRKKMKEFATQTIGQANLNRIHQKKKESA